MVFSDMADLIPTRVEPSTMSKATPVRSIDEGVGRGRHRHGCDDHWQAWSRGSQGAGRRTPFAQDRPDRAAYSRE